MKDRIYIKDWLALKPYEKQISTDSYYIGLSNKVLKCFYTKQGLPTFIYLDSDDLKTLSCFLTSYFEDIISETNIWNTFLKLHSEKYGRMLPFYSTDEYYQEEINVQDIGFLIWYFMNTVQNEKFVSPFNEFLNNIALQVLEIFENEFEYAPENEKLNSYYTIDKNETDYYKVRQLMETILFRTYIFHTDTNDRLTGMFDEVIKQGRDENTMQYFQEVHDFLLHKAHTRLLSLKGNIWCAEILGEEHPLYHDLKDMSPRINGYFFYKGQDTDNVFIEHIASGKNFKLTKKSFDHYGDLTDDDILYLGIVRWQKEWWFSGVYFKSEYNTDLILKEKNSVKSRAQVNFLDHDSGKTNEILQQQYKAFLDFNHGSPIAFLPADKTQEFIQKSMEYYNNSLGLSEKLRAEARERAKKDGFFGDQLKSEIDFSEEVESTLVFFNPKSGTEIAFGVNKAFPMPQNPFYDENGHDDDVMHVFISDEISTELALFCIEQGKDKLPFLKEGVGALYLNDIDFLLRFWKSDAYHSKPEITLTGQNK